METREWLKFHGLTARLLSFAKTWPQVLDGSKTVTRRWSTVLKRGDLVEPVEWSPRLGERFCCVVCKELLKACRCSHVELGDLWEPKTRKPQRGPLKVVVSVREERLGKITPEDVEREGFPGMLPSEFIAMFIGLDPSASARPWTTVERRKYERACGSTVFRIEFIEIPLDDAGLSVVGALRSSRAAPSKPVRCAACHGTGWTVEVTGGGHLAHRCDCGAKTSVRPLTRSAKCAE